ncbi:MAG: M28 family peptidase [Verrucomicrobiales bacterium]|nr:M28 family peptidase [Verrucomicrobiales bacterium]
MSKRIVRRWLLGLLIFLFTVLAGIFGFVWIFLAQPGFRSGPASDKTVSSSALERHVRVLSEDFIPRNAAHIGNMNRTADYIKSEFEKAGTGRITEQWYETGSYRYRNVSLLLGDPEKQRIVIGAHYDAFGRFPAADDNASGVAGLIELAKLIAANPVDVTVELVGYPLEEPPYFGTSQMGSWQHVAHLQKSGVACRFMVSLEMIGYFSDQPGSQDYPHDLLHLFYPDKGNFITVVGNTENRVLIKQFKAGMKGATKLPVYSVCGPAMIPGIDFSDHRNYWQAGIPAVMVTDTAFYRNKAYHTAGDVADKLDFEKMALVVVGVYEAIAALKDKN